MEFQIQEPISQLRLRSDAGHRRAVHAPVAPAPGRGELLPPQRAGELRQLAGVRLAGTGRPGRRPWRPAPRFLPLQLEGRRLPSGYPPRLPAPGGGPVSYTHLAQIEQLGIFETLERGIFADIKRPRDGGKGLDGVVNKAAGYFNPFLEPMMEGGAGK